MLLSPSKYFPRPQVADAQGLVSVTPTMTVEMLLDAYQHGIFPWSEDPVRWYSPSPRALFLREYVQWPKKLGKVMRKQRFTVTFDTAFEDVVRGCAAAHANQGVWISDLFVQTYTALHEERRAHSVEVWQEGVLAGGLYGVHLGGMFAGESMFYRVPNASKVAFAYLMAHLWHCGVHLVDAQVINEHTARLGAVLVNRQDFLLLLRHALKLQTLYNGTRWPEVPVALPPTVSAAPRVSGE